MTIFFLSARGNLDKIAETIFMLITVTNSANEMTAGAALSLTDIHWEGLELSLSPGWPADGLATLIVPAPGGGGVIVLPLPPE